MFSRITSTVIKSCPLCAQGLQTTLLNGRNRLVCFTCEFVHWDNPLPVTATLIPKNNKIVLVRRKYPPFVDDWCLPGGFIEAHESPGESAIREVEEETGLKIEIDRILDAFAPGKGINVIIIFYLAKPAQGDLLAGDDATEVSCFWQADLPKNIAFPLHKKMIDKWFDENCK
jgi:ADP-ribose pyrophosphatase YjhB (NUDIX family)